MKKNIFAVCDLEVDYALNFMDYLNHKKNIPFEIQAFTNVESLIAYGKMNHIELLLISILVPSISLSGHMSGMIGGFIATLLIIKFMPLRIWKKKKPENYHNLVN